MKSFLSIVPWSHDVHQNPSILSILYFSVEMRNFTDNSKNLCKEKALLQRFLQKGFF